MTEQEWLAHEDPAPLLAFVAGRAGERRLRLFLCACCARVLEGAFSAGLITAAGRQMGSLGTLWAALRTVEQYADGLCDYKALAAARRATEEAVDVPASIDYGGETGLGREAASVRRAAARPLTAERAVAAYGEALATLQSHHFWATRRPAGAPVKPVADHQREMAGWLRDVVGNPSRPAALDPAWLARGDGNVGKVAESIYAGGSFGELRFLADALEDAGCTDAEILGHCRGPGPHVRGCWALDLFIEAPRRFARAAAAAPPEEEGPPAAPAAPAPAPPRPPLRPGDWVCPICQAHNFARRDACIRCRRAAAAAAGRVGDWLCSGCNAHNFARRQSCHQCQRPRPS